MEKHLFFTLLLSSLSLGLSAIHNHAELITLELSPTAHGIGPDTDPTRLTEEAPLATSMPEIPSLDISTKSNKLTVVSPGEELGAHSIEDEPVEEELVKEFNLSTSIDTDDLEESMDNNDQNEDREFGIEAPEMDIE